jgi:ribonuclease H / adenosylcobalamin/alpha-ribazole phosphatase
MKTAIAYIDGSGNSERIQACAVTLNMDGVVFEQAQTLPRHTTNNVGEYSGLLLCLRCAKRLGVEALEIHSDSMLIVNQVNAKWKCRDPTLQELRNLVWQEAQDFVKLSISWVPREENSRADALCREAIKNAEAEERDHARPRPANL